MSSATFPSLHYYLRNAANTIKTPTDIYLLEKKNNNPFSPITYAEVLDNANAVSAYLMHMGLAKQAKVALIIENCPEYIMFDQGLMQAGMVNVSIYPTLSEGEVQHIINDSGSEAILVGTPFLLKKVLKVKDACPTLRQVIIAYETETRPAGVITWNEMIEQGRGIYPGMKEAIEQRLQSVTRDDLSCLLYTSGTTGKPKGAMLTHNNFITNAEMAIDLCPIVNKNYRFLSFLPLCHVYERTATYYLSTYVGAQVAFAQSLEALSNNIIEARPHAITTVPRLLERIEERVRKNVTQKGGMSLKIFNWAFHVGEQRRHNHEAGKGNG
ncbi:MAG: AMP-binding protein, partial [Bacteroidota bacterium]